MPDAPVELDQVTLVTPTLSLAVPLTVSELAEVPTFVVAGERIFNDGGVVSGRAGVVGCVGLFAGGLVGGGFADKTCWRVTVRFCDARFCCESVAVIEMTLEPTLSGTAGMVHCVEPCAIPEAPGLVDQLTCASPEPPDVVPLIAMVDAVAELGSASTVRTSGF